MVDTGRIAVARPTASERARTRMTAVGRAAAWNVVTAVVCYVAAMLSIKATVPGTTIALFWPANGIAAAIGVLVGPHVAIGVFLAELAFETAAFGSVASGGSAALANATLVLTVVVMVRRWGGPNLFRTPAGVAKYAGIVLGSTAVCTAFAVSVMYVAGTTAPGDVVITALTWWGGEVVALMLVTPAICLWARRDETAPLGGTRWELAFLVACSAAVGSILVLPVSAAIPDLGVFALPLVAWAAFRFTAPIVTATTLALSLGAMLRMYFFPPASDGVEAFLHAEIFIAFVSLIGLALSATVSTQARVVRDAAAREFEAVDVARNRLLSSFAHELNNPLTPIILQVEIMKEDPRGPEQARSIAVIERNITRLARLVRDLRDVSNIQSGRGLRLSTADVDLAKIAADAVEEHRPQAAERGVMLALQTGDGAYVSGDSDRLSQVMGNLLSNAIKYAPTGSTIHVHTGRAGDLAFASVADRGPGLTEQQIARLFEPFAQVQPSEHQKAGTGLGLYVSQGIVLQHGGSLVCSSRPDSGATFRVEFPVKITPPAASRVDVAPSGSVTAVG